MNVLIELTDAQAKAIEMIGDNDVTKMATSAVSSAIKGKLSYYINGAACDASEATHQITRTLSNGVKKTTNYKGGLREGANAAYEMAKRYLPKEVTKAAFVADALSEAMIILGTLTAKDSNVEEVTEFEQ